MTTASPSWDVNVGVLPLLQDGVGVELVQAAPYLLEGLLNRLALDM